MFAAHFNNQSKRTLRSGNSIKGSKATQENDANLVKPAEKLALAKRTRTALGDVSNVQLQQDRSSAKGSKKNGAKPRVGAPTRTIVVPEAAKTEAEVKSDAVAKTEAVAVKVKPLTRSRSQKTATGKTAKPHEVAEVSQPPLFAAPVKVDRQKADVGTVEPVEHIIKRAKTIVPDWNDLDAEDMFDPLMVSEYVDDIFEYMKDLEVQTLPKSDYMDLQKDLTWKMRSILADWLVEVHSKFRLLPETLYLTMNIIDRFLSLRVVAVAKLQLVGVTAMFIAAKYEEIVAPSIQNYLYVVEGYSDEEIIKAERYVLQVLDFGLQYPSPMSFLRRCSKADKYDNQTRTLAKYLMEVSLIDNRFLKITPSCIAASGLYLARCMLNRGKWDSDLVHYSGYAESELEECVALILHYLSSPMKYEALFKKYSAKKFMKAAIFAEDWISKTQGTDIMDGAVTVGEVLCRE